MYKSFMVLFTRKKFWNALLCIKPVAYTHLMEEDLAGAGYNVNQSKIAIGSGGLWGKGFLNGTPVSYTHLTRMSPRTDRLAQAGFIVISVGQRGGHPSRCLLYTSRCV